MRLRTCYLIPLLIFLISFSSIYGQNHDNGHAQIFSQSFGFVENKGQLHDQFHKPVDDVRFKVALPGGLNILLKSNSFSYDTYQCVTDSSVVNPLRKGIFNRTINDSIRYEFHRIDISLPGAAVHPEIIAEYPSTHFLQYFIDNKQIQVSPFQKVTYRNIYPRIDLVFESSESEKGFEYYFIVHPGGDPDKIRLRYEGAFSTRIIHNRIELSVAKGKLLESIPASYQSFKSFYTLKDLRNERQLKVNYKSTGKDEYGFFTHGYDRSQSLIIDPKPDLLWGTYYGKESGDFAYAVTLDKSGNLFLAGTSTSSYGIATSGAYQQTLQGFSDAVLGKITADGKLLWMTYFGGESFDEASAIAIDATGSVYIGGWTQSYANISTPGAHQTIKATLPGAYGAFLAKFSNNGQRLWSTYYAGDSLEACFGVAVDGNNNVVITGYTSSLTGIATPGSYKATRSPAPTEGSMVFDAYIAKFNSNGQRIWGTYFGGSVNDAAYEIAIDKDNNIIITGGTSSPDGIATSNAFQRTISSNGPATRSFIARFSSSGNLLWGTYYGKGSGNSIGLCVTTDELNNIYAGGYTNCTNDIATAGAHQSGFDPDDSPIGYVVKFTYSGQREWGTYFGGPSNAYVNDIKSDGANGLYITGSALMNSVVATIGAYQESVTFAGAYLSKFDNNGKQLWGTWYGDGGYWNGSGEAVIPDGKGNVYVAGQTSALNKIATCDAFQKKWVLNQDMFFAKFSESPKENLLPVVTITTGTDEICEGTSVTFFAQPVNGGSQPHYQWMVNNITVGTDMEVYTSASFKAGDKVSCVLSTSPNCAPVKKDTSNVIAVRIKQAISPSLSIMSDKDSICIGELLELNAIPVNAGNDYSFTWLLNGAVTGNNSNVLSSNDFLNGDVIKCELVKHNACGADSIALSNEYIIKTTEAIFPRIFVQSSDLPVCQREPVVFEAVTESAGNNPFYQWQVNGLNVGINSNQFSSNELNNGDHIQCLLTPENKNCLNADFVESNIVPATISPLPDIKFYGDTIISKGKAASIKVNIPSNALNYGWRPAVGLNDVSSLQPVMTPLETTTYTFDAVSEAGCKSSKSITIVVLSKIAIPNSFTPNDDGKNDSFKALYGSDVAHAQLTVFNRYGQVVFSSSGSSLAWDGRYKSIPQETGSYVWMFTYTNGGKRLILKGTVLLLR